MLPQGKVSAAGAKRQKRSDGPCSTKEPSPQSMATSSGQSLQTAATSGQQHKSAGRFPQGTFFFRAQFGNSEGTTEGKHAVQTVILVFSPEFPTEVDVVLPQQLLQGFGIRHKPPTDEAGPSTSSVQSIEYGPLECSVQLQTAGSESTFTGHLEAASPSSGPLDPPPSTSYIPPESIVARVRSRRKKNRGLVELVDFQEAGPDEKLGCGYIGSRGLLAWGLGFDATGLCLFPLSQGGRNIVSGWT